MTRAGSLRCGRCCRRVLPPMLEIGSPLELIPPPQVLRRFGIWWRRAQRNAAAQALLADEITRCRADPRLAQRRTGDPSKQHRRLVRDPVLLHRTAQAAVESDDAWLDAVCKETLRVRPVVPAAEIPRRACRPGRLAAPRRRGATLPRRYLRPARDAYRDPRSPTQGRAVPDHGAGRADKAPSRDDGAPPGGDGDGPPSHLRHSPRRVTLLIVMAVVRLRLSLARCIDQPGSAVAGEAQPWSSVWIRDEVKVTESSSTAPG